MTIILLYATQCCYCLAWDYYNNCLYYLKMENHPLSFVERFLLEKLCLHTHTHTHTHLHSHERNRTQQLLNVTQTAVGGLSPPRTRHPFTESHTHAYTSTPLQLTPRAGSGVSSHTQTHTHTHTCAHTHTLVL